MTDVPDFAHPATGLQALRAQQWLRPLDIALALRLAAHDGDMPPSLQWAAALCSWLDGQGHSCLPLKALQQEPARWLGWPAEALQSSEGSTEGMHAQALSLHAPSTESPAAANTSSDGIPPQALLAMLRSLPSDEAAAQAAWGACPAVALVQGPSGERLPRSAALVLSRGRLYLRRRYVQEMGIEEALRQRMQEADAQALHRPSPERARPCLDALFPPADAQGPDWQKLACALALRSTLTLITGGPGTGKTYTAARLLMLLHRLHEGPAPLRVALAAPTGKAAARLRQSLGAALAGSGPPSGAPKLGEPGLQAEALPPGLTLHRLLQIHPEKREPHFHAQHPLDLDVLLVDEASMIDLEMMHMLLQALGPGTRLILLGDPDQLASVETGSVLGDLTRQASGYSSDTRAWLQACTGCELPAPPQLGTALAQHTVALQRSRRFSGPIGQLARALQDGDGPAALALLQPSSPTGPAPHAQALSAQAGPGQLELFPSGRAGPSQATGSPATSPNASPTPAPDAATALAWLGPGLGEGAAQRTSSAQAFALLEALSHCASQGRHGAPASHADYLRLIQSRPEQADADGPAGEMAFQTWVRSVLQAFEGFRVLCALREGPLGVDGLNQSIEQALARAGLLRPGSLWFEGRPVMLTRNEPALNLFNGDVGLLLRERSAAGRPGELRVWFQEGSDLKSVAPSQLSEVETAFAMTIHKSQGSEFGHVLLVLPPAPHPLLSRELVYTGITRARQAVSLAAPSADSLTHAVAHPTLRCSGLGMSASG